MPDIKISVGGSLFDVACKAGEEDYLRSAAELLDVEALAIRKALGRLPENRMLLMAGLMLADKTMNTESDQTPEPDAELETRIAELEASSANLQKALRAAEEEMTALQNFSQKSQNLLGQLVSQLETVAKQAANPS